MSIFGTGTFGTSTFSGSGAPAGVEVTLQDALGFSVTMAVKYGVRLAEALNLSTLLAAELDSVIRELLRFSTPIEAQATRSAAVLDTLRLRGRLNSVQEAAVLEALAFADSPLATRRVLASLVDRMVLTGAASNTYRAMALLVDTFVLREVFKSVQDATIQDVVNLEQTLAARYSAYATLVDQAMFADVVASEARVTVLLRDSMVFTAQADPRATLVAAIRDGLNFSVAFSLGDETYFALSLNTATNAISTYTNYQFNSMANFAGRTCAIGAGGLYTLGGDDDAGAPIIWRLRTGMSTLGTQRHKGMDAAYLGYTASGRILLKCIVVSNSGEKIGYWYELTPKDTNAPGPGRIPVGRKLKSVYWGFEMTNLDAGDIELDVLELHPIVFEGRLP